ncbi:MAG TPA: hypothetical protein VKH36_01215, partial [Acidimicrobiia bacterium]|nr:hypothetical protein [Acidimicrobiia bacterium]
MNRRQFLLGAVAAGAAAVAGAVIGFDEYRGSGSAHVRRRARATAGTPPTAGPRRVPADALHAEWIAEENAKPGTADWQITGPAEGDAIEGFASVVSAVQGEKVQLFVSTGAKAFHVEAYRMGSYGGKGG